MAAPKGNKNALKHGFYSRHLTPAESNLLDLLKLDDEILSEIKLLRILNDRLMAYIAGRKIYVEDDLAIIQLITTNCATIGNLITRRAFQTGKISSVNEAINAAISAAAPLVFPNLAKKK